MMHILLTGLIAMYKTKDKRYRKLDNDSRVNLKVKCPNWYDRETVACLHPWGVVIVGSSKEGCDMKAVLVDLIGVQTLKLPELDYAVKDFGMTFDGQVTIAGGNICDKYDKEKKILTKGVIQLQKIDDKLSWKRITTDLTNAVAHLMLVSDEKYLYALGGEHSVKCEWLSKEKMDEWKELPDLPSVHEKKLAKEYNGSLYCGAVIYEKKIRVLTRTRYLTLEDPEDITKRRWTIQLYTAPQRNQPVISQLTPIVNNGIIVASVKRGKANTLECFNNSTLTWEKIASKKYACIGAGRIATYMPSDK